MNLRSWMVVSLLLLMSLAFAACIQPLQMPADGGQESTSSASEESTMDEKTGGEEVALYVGPTLVNCEGVAPQTCMLVKTDPNGEYTYFYDQIEGFDYVPGYEYELLVMIEEKENVPADASSLSYSLIEVVDATEVGPTLEGQAWQLASLADENGQLNDALADVEVTATFEDDAVSGKDGCNNYTGSYTVDGTILAISPNMAMTMMACPEPIMQQSSAYLAALEATRSYRIVDNQLQLLDESSQPVAVFDERVPTSLTGTTWHAIGYNNGKEAVVSVIIDTEITAVFGEDGSLSGSAGCNNYSTGYEANESNIQIGPGAVTMKMCAEPEGIMEQEAQYLAALEMAEVYTIDGDRLQMRTAEGSLVADYRVAESAEGTETTEGGAAAIGSQEDLAKWEGNLEGTPWQLTNVAGEDGQLTDVLADVEVTALFEDGTVAGSDGCNNYSGSYTVDGTALTISPNLAMTMMACPDPITQQTAAYMAALEATRSYQIADSQLMLLDQSGNPVAIFDERVPASLTGATWSATGYNNGKGGVTSLVIGSEITALFGEDGTLSGSSGCNNYSAGYETDGEQIQIGPAAATMMFCPNPDVMLQEVLYLASLNMAEVYRIDGNKLELRTGEGSLVVSYEAMIVADDVSPDNPASDGATDTDSSSTESTGGAATAESAASEVETLANMTYQSEYTADGTAPLTNGEYSEEAAPGSATKTIVRLSEHVATGELNGQTAAAVVLVTDPGGSGTFFDLALVMEQEGTPVNVATAHLGDRVKINAMTIEDDQIVVDMIEAGPNDPLCCPSQQVVKTFALEGDKLVENSSEVVGAEDASQAAGTAAALPSTESAIVGKEWHWYEFQGDDGHKVFVRDPSRYTLTLDPDGSAMVLADCNNGNGAYTMDGDSLTINIVALTRALCPSDSLSDDYLRLLDEVVTYAEDGENLVLNLADDVSKLFFQTIEATAAQVDDPTATIPQDAISVDPGPLGTSYHWQVLPATPYDASMPPVPVGAPPHAVVTFDYMPAPKALVEGGPYIVVYPVEEYIDLWQAEGNETIAATVDALKTLLAEQPVNPSAPLPILPLPGGVNDVAVQSAYLDFTGGAGLRFVGRTAQDASPLLNGQLAYYFQGLTDDERFYVSIRWPITTAALPENMIELTADEQQAISDNFEAYMQDTAQTLKGLSSSDWQPALDELDALVNSFTLSVPDSGE